MEVAILESTFLDLKIDKKQEDFIKSKLYNAILNSNNEFNVIYKDDCIVRDEEDSLRKLFEKAAKKFEDSFKDNILYGFKSYAIELLDEYKEGMYLNNGRVRLYINYTRYMKDVKFY